MSEEDPSDSNSHCNESIHDVLNNLLLSTTPSLFKVETYYSGTKRVYIYEAHEDNTITGLVHELINEPQEIDKPKEIYEPQEIDIYYKKRKSKSSKQAWQMQTFKAKRFKFIDYSEPPIDISSLFIKYGWNRIVDSGSSEYSGIDEYIELEFPIYRISNLPLEPEVQNNLTKLLQELGESRQDWHIDSPVMDIIDPDLNPNYYIKIYTENPSEREKYSWYPVDILLRPDNSFKLLGEIHNLPKQGNEELYECLLKVFKLMLPGFRELEIFDDKNEEIIQVVVKAQKYQIQPNTSYSGKWHVEGKTENIVAGGVYYCKIEPKTQNDYLTFMPKTVPQKYYINDTGIFSHVNVPVNEQAAIVFSNNIPHKFSCIENIHSQDIERFFINFFIVDPQKRLETNQIRIEAFNILRKKSRLPKMLIDEILSFVYSYDNIITAKERREKVRQSMKVDSAGWGYISYGNSGEYFFKEERSEISNRDQWDQ